MVSLAGSLAKEINEHGRNMLFVHSYINQASHSIAEPLWQTPTVARIVP